MLHIAICDNSGEDSQETRRLVEQALGGYTVRYNIQVFESGEELLVSSVLFDLIFMDPPYGRDLEKQALSFLAQSPLLKPGGKIIVEASKDASFDYLDGLGLVQTKCKSYKTNMHVFIERRE